MQKLRNPQVNNRRKTAKAEARKLADAAKANVDKARDR